jgi:hypothetical protein
MSKSKRGSRTPGPAHNFLVTPDTWRPARRLKPQALRSCLRPGLRVRNPALPEVFARAGRTRPAFSRSASSPERQPRHSAGRTDLRRGLVPNTQEPPNWLAASRARGSRDPGRRRRSRPTLRRLARASPGGRDSYLGHGSWRLSRTFFPIMKLTKLPFVL